MKFTAQQIADFLNGRVEGNKEATVSNFAKIEDAKEGTITFLANPKYTNYIYETKATIVLVNEDMELEKEVTATLIRVSNAYESLAKLMQVYESSKPKKTGKSRKASISRSATLGKDCYIADFVVIDKNAKIGNNVHIYPNCYIGDNVTIGDNTIIYSNVSIHHSCNIGANCVFHSGVVIGSDGFGFAPSSSNDYEKIPQIGNVIIEDYVEVGANSTIDRATMGSTIIRKGVKLDNLVQVAHNVEIGEHTVIAAQTGISGSTKLGRHMMVGGQVGFAGHITIADEVKIGAQSGLNNSIKQEGAILMGSPVTDMSAWRRSVVLTKRLPDMQSAINKLEKELATLKETLNK